MASTFLANKPLLVSNLPLEASNLPLEANNLPPEASNPLLVANNLLLEVCSPLPEDNRGRHLTRPPRDLLWEDCTLVLG